MPTTQQGLVVYADGSSRPNPGFGGYGLFGYHYKLAPRPKNTKHPIKTAMHFTTEGMSRDKGAVSIEVVNILEAAIAIEGNTVTNNIAELKAAIHALGWVEQNEAISEILVLTDSSYVVNNFRDHLKNWIARDCRKLDGTTISNDKLWRELDQVRTRLYARGVTITLKWIKGHSDNYGNDLADMHSVIASNAARIQMQEGTQSFVPEVIETNITYAQFKASYQNKDVVYYFKDIFFTSAPINDAEHCFMSTTEDETNAGRRTTDSIFLVNKGYVPDLINRLRTFYRNVTRNYVCTCSIKLIKLENRDMLRIADQVDVAYLLLPVPRTSNLFTLIGTTGPFLQENTMEYPFIVNINKLSAAMVRMQENEDLELTSYCVKGKFIEEDKLKLSNKDKFIDLSDLVEGKIVFSQRPVLGVGYDVPAYLTLKKIESEIQSLEVIFDKDKESNFYTLYTKITTPNREICSVNMLNKYLAMIPKSIK